LQGQTDGQTAVASPRLVSFGAVTDGVTLFASKSYWLLTNTARLLLAYKHVVLLLMARKG